jgi:excisionase family DNA binding protein
MIQQKFQLPSIPYSMNKRDAADFLGVSVRAVERYTSKGKLKVSYKHGKNGLQAEYDLADLERFKQELEQPAYPTHFPAPTNGDALTPATSTALVETASTIKIGISGLIAELQTLNKSIKPNGHLSVSLADKLTLSLLEASALSGLSRSFLTGAIHTRKLKAAKRGRGWNIKRADLEAYIKKF